MKAVLISQQGAQMTKSTNHITEMMQLLSYRTGSVNSLYLGHENIDINFGAKIMMFYYTALIRNLRPKITTRHFSHLRHFERDISQNSATMSRDRGLGRTLHHL